MRKNDEQKVNKLKKEKVKSHPVGGKRKNRKFHSIAALRCGWLGLF